MIKGLLDQLKEEGNKNTYSPLTLESLKKVIEEILFSESTKEEARSYVMYTGIMGYYVYQLTLAGVNTPQCYYSITTYSKSKLIVLNLGKKSGLHKAVINLRHPTARVEIRIGTVTVTSSMSFDQLTVFLSNLPLEQPTFITKKGVTKYIK